MQNLYSNINPEILFPAGNPGLSKSYAMSEIDFENELLASPYDDEDEEDKEDDDEDDEDEDEDLDEDVLVDDEEIDLDEDEDADLDELDDDEIDTEEDLAASSVAARSEAGTRPAVVERPPDKEALAAAGLAFNCYICEEPSGEICARCTRDTCDNHICERCMLCSDCCTCDSNPR